MAGGLLRLLKYPHDPVVWLCCHPHVQAEQLAQGHLIGGRPWRWEPGSPDPKTEGGRSGRATWGPALHAALAPALVLVSSLRTSTSQL